MSKSIVKTPQNALADYDYIAFSFSGRHSVEDFGIYRVGDGAGYNENLTPQINDKTADQIGRDGQFYLSSNYQPRIFNIKFAFDNVNEQKLREIKRWLDTEDVGDLWFAEAPHKVYSAKISGAAMATANVFREERERIYKGTGTL